MNIVYSSSDAYVECTGISLWSLLDNNKNEKEINIYVLSTDIRDLNQKRLQKIAHTFKREIYIIDAKQDFVDAAEKFKLPLMRGAYNTYSRICLNNWFNDLDKILVIDADTMICGPLNELWNTNLDGKLLAAVPEVAMYGLVNNIESKEIINEKPMYYNMGICLVNLKEWRNRNIDEYLSKRIQTETEPYRVADQSIINKYLNEDIVRIDLKFNYYSVVHEINYSTINKVFSAKKVFSVDEYEGAKRDIRIIHYFGHSFERPWFKWNAAYRKKDYFGVRNETPWGKEQLRKWSKSKSRIIRIYDTISFVLLSIGARDFCLKFRYYYGQKIKGIVQINR
jgi:lipopolysaccharide biosynthesis glycosyltransferase